MIQGVAIGPKGDVFSVKRDGGTSFVLAHTSKSATVVYETKDKLESLWVSDAGNIHAVGKQYHTNATPKRDWKSSKLPEACFAVWGTADDDLFVGGLEGAILHFKNNMWTEIANVGELVAEIGGWSEKEVFFVGQFEALGFFDGKTFSEKKSPASIYGQSLYADRQKKDLYIVSTDSVFLIQKKPDAKPTLLAELGGSGELYGVGIGKAGIWVHAGWELGKVNRDSKTIDCSYTNDDNDKALMVKRATYASRMTSNGKIIVAAGARSVIVNEGKGFVEWPEPGAKPNKAATPTPKKKSASVKKKK